MANESNYTIVLLYNDNQVPESLACPNCHQDDMDMLQIDDDTVTCLDCGHVYTI